MIALNDLNLLVNSCANVKDGVIALNDLNLMINSRANEVEIS